jgi:subtilisin-like proprotein convertase family protein
MLIVRVGLFVVLLLMIAVAVAITFFYLGDLALVIITPILAVMSIPAYRQYARLNRR